MPILVTENTFCMISKGGSDLFHSAFPSHTGNIEFLLKALIFNNESLFVLITILKSLYKKGDQYLF